MSQKALRTAYLVVLIILVPIFIALSFRVERFIDEDIAIVHGQRFLRAMLEGSDASRTAFKLYDSTNSIGLPVTLASGIAFNIWSDIISVRLGMLIWACLFWFSILKLLQAMIEEALPKGSNPRTILVVILSVCAVGLIQSMQYLWTNQIQALGEVPGAGATLLGITFTIRRRFTLAAMWLGFATVLKPYYLVYLPLPVLTYILSGSSEKKSLRTSVFVIAALVAPLVSVQILKFFAMDTKAYIQSLEAYFSILQYQAVASGHGRLLEFPNYSWRTQAYWFLGTFGFLFCAIKMVLFDFRRGHLNRHLLLIIGLSGVFVLVGSLSWMFVNQFQWWRRVLPFIVPGYAILVCYCVSSILLLKRSGLKNFATVCLVILSCYVLIRQSVFGVIDNQPPLTTEQRKSLIDNVFQ